MAFFIIPPSLSVGNILENSALFFSERFSPSPSEAKYLDWLKIVLVETVIMITDQSLATILCLPAGGKRRKDALAYIYIYIICTACLLFIDGYDFVDDFVGFLAVKKK